MPTAGAKPNDALADHEFVIRRVLPGSRRPDGKREISKSQFSPSSPQRDPEEGMSVDLMSNLTSRGIDPSDKAQFAPDHEVLMTLKVRDLHDRGMWVVPRPLPTNPAHCNVLGVAKNKRKSILLMAEFLRRPDDVVKATD
jgi:hypothetical protein